MRTPDDGVVPSVCVVGAGPRGTSIVERLCANAAALTGTQRLTLHLVEPFAAGPGRVWRTEQSELLWLNTTAADNTMFPDSSVACEGPVGTGPSFLEWATGEAPDLLAGSELAEEVGRVHGGWFPSRRLYSRYLAWTLERAAALAPPSVSLQRHSARVVDLTEDGGRQQVWLEGLEEPLVVDVVVLAQGYQEVSASEEEAALAAFAREHGLAYLPRAYTADVDLSRFGPGMAVLVRGAGLAFVDSMVLLFEGRGGRYERRQDGRLVYHPSGQEPRLLVGSRRGVPYHSKTTYGLGGPRPPVPHFLTLDRLRDLHSRLGPLDYARDVRPLVARELAFGYYHELWHAHPERTAGSWEALVEALGGAQGAPEREPAAPGEERDPPGVGSAGEGAAAEAAGGLPDLVAAVVAVVPDPDDRLDLRWLERPLDGAALAGTGGLAAWMERYVAADLARRRDPAHSADLGMVTALLSCFGVLGLASSAGLLSARALALGVDGEFHGFLSYFASGPPAPRLEQLAALARAGLVEFLGADLQVSADKRGGCFRAERAAGPPLEARALLEARLPAPSVERSRDPLVSRLLARGACSEDVRRDPGDGFVYRTGRLRTDSEHRVVEASGVAHPARYALGPWTTGGRFSSGIARPGMNGAFFRQNDALARAMLAQAVGGGARARDPHGRDPLGYPGPGGPAAELPGAGSQAGQPA